jgi:hypothetical protein
MGNGKEREKDYVGAWVPVGRAPLPPPRVDALQTVPRGSEKICSQRQTKRNKATNNDINEID